MENIESIIECVLKLFPEMIDISDGEMRSDNGFFSQKLSIARLNAEKKNGVHGNDIDFMIWCVFGLLHRMSRENFAKKTYCVYLNDIDIEELKKEYKNAVEEAD